MPYAAESIADFWRRWHISLSNWLRDYLYFSLPGLRSKWKIFTYFNLILTMVLGGLWHGGKLELRHLGSAARRGLAVDAGVAGLARAAKKPADGWRHIGAHLRHRELRLLHLDLLPRRPRWRRR